MNEDWRSFKLAILLCQIISLLFASSLAVAAQTQTPADQTAKIKIRVEKIGVGSDITVKLTAGKTYHGLVNKIEDATFEITEVDLKTSLTIRYVEVKKVESGYGPKGAFGNRIGKNKRTIGRIAMIGLAAFLTVVIIVGLKDNPTARGPQQPVTPK